MLLFLEEDEKEEQNALVVFEASRYEEGLDKFRIYHLYLGFTHAYIHTHIYIE